MVFWFERLILGGGLVGCDRYFNINIFGVSTFYGAFSL